MLALEVYVHTHKIQDQPNEEESNEDSFEPDEDEESSKLKEEEESDKKDDKNNDDNVDDNNDGGNDEMVIQEPNVLDETVTAEDEVNLVNLAKEVEMSEAESEA